MKVLLINLTRGGISGGYYKYLYNILTRMADHSDIENILCISPRQFQIRDWFDQHANIDFMNYEPRGLFHRNIYPKLENSYNNISPDVIFVPTERYFAFRNIPMVNMVQNMEPFVYSSKSNPISERIISILRRKVSHLALHKSHRIIAVSKYVKEYLVTKMGIPKTKIYVIYHGFHDSENNCGTKPTIIPADWKGSFLFTAGSIRPARGLEDILRAVNILVGMNHNINLVIAGKTVTSMASYKRSLQYYTSKNGIHNRILWTDSLSTEEMKWCYQNCKCFIMTSRVESFGMIGLEAMSHGCICITADNPCLPEIFEDAAIYYSPRNSDMLAQRIQTVLDWNIVHRSAFSKRSLMRATNFSWDVCAEKTIRVLADAASIQRTSKGKNEHGNLPSFPNLMKVKPLSCFSHTCRWELCKQYRQLLLSRSFPIR